EPWPPSPAGPADRTTGPVLRRADPHRRRLRAGGGGRRHRPRQRAGAPGRRDRGGHRPRGRGRLAAGGAARRQDLRHPRPAPAGTIPGRARTHRARAAGGCLHPVGARFHATERSGRRRVRLAQGRARRVGRPCPHLGGRLAAAEKRLGRDRHGGAHPAM
ncbi:MAG: RidA/YER057c/UK114 superfamily, group 1, partial [uncultured Ramlibacter sp.]